jgi:hypothetical protein
VNGRPLPTVHQWLDARKLEVWPEAIATVPNKDPRAKVSVWSLHAIRPKVMTPPATAPAPTTEPAR